MKQSEIKAKGVIYFKEENLPYKIVGFNGRFAICTRRLNRRHDADMLKQRVEMQAYLSFTNAYNDLKNEPIYSIVDFDNAQRGPHNLVFNPYDFKEEYCIKNCLRDLKSGKTELSGRYTIQLNISKIVIY